MKRLILSILISIGLLMVSSIACAGDFGWMGDFNVQAEADPSDFRARLGARFKVGDVEINAVLSNAENPAEAYILLCIGEMSNQPIYNVIEKYKNVKRKGWGALAKSLGIKPGSKEFHALKQGQNLYVDLDEGKSNVKDKGKGKGKAKGKSKGKN